MTTIWCMFPDIWSATATDIIFCLVILDCFLPFYPPNNPKNQNLEKKTPGDIITLNKRTINDNHMMYVSWEMKRHRRNFLSFWIVFCPFTPLTTRKIKILKKWKKYLEISSFYTSVPKIMILCYSSTLRRKFLHFSIKKLFTFFIRSILKTLIVESIFAWVEILLHEI